jgi:hypothetical protein
MVEPKRDPPFCHPGPKNLSFLRGPFSSEWAKIGLSYNKPTVPMLRVAPNRPHAQQNAQRRLAEALSGLRIEAPMNRGAAASLVANARATFLALKQEYDESSISGKVPAAAAGADSPHRPKSSSSSHSSEVAAPTLTNRGIAPQQQIAVARSKDDDHNCAPEQSTSAGRRPQSAPPNTSPAQRSPRAGGLARPAEQRPAWRSDYMTVGFMVSGPTDASGAANGGIVLGQEEEEEATTAEGTAAPPPQLASKRAQTEMLPPFPAPPPEPTIGLSPTSIAPALPGYRVESSRDWRGRRWTPRSAPPARTVWQQRAPTVLSPTTHLAPRNGTRMARDRPYSAAASETRGIMRMSPLVGTRPQTARG